LAQSPADVQIQFAVNFSLTDKNVGRLFYRILLVTGELKGYNEKKTELLQKEVCHGIMFEYGNSADFIYGTGKQ
jgi:hypothetical protein